MSTDEQVGGRGAEGAAPVQETRPPVSVAELWTVALALPGWDASACAAAERRLSELCAARADVAVSGPWRLPALTVPSPSDVVIPLAARSGGPVCAWLELEAVLARGVVDLALGGTADTAELGLVEPLDATRAGVLLYMAASVLGSVPQGALRILDVQRASDLALPERLACTARITLQGRVYGAQLSVDVSALPAPPSALQSLRDASVSSLPSWLSEATCQVTLELAHGALSPESLASLTPGDVLIPDIVTAEPGPWESATLRCDLTSQALASVRRDASGALTLAEARGPESREPSSAGLTRFTVEAARVRARLVDVQAWLVEGRLPWGLDPHAPLTLWQGQHALARGHLVRDRSDVGLCIESVRDTEPATLPC